MKINHITAYTQINTINRNKNLKRQALSQPDPINGGTDTVTTDNVNFKGKAGSLVGIVIGGAAAVGLAFVAAPVLICSGPLLAIGAGTVCDKLQDKLSGDK